MSHGKRRLANDLLREKISGRAHLMGRILVHFALPK
jgi:hypothetical protein